jgi:ADP-ribose diphosphatase
MEEAGVGARSLLYLKNIHMSPSYMERSIDIVFAEDLYEASLPGDEPEPLAKMEWSLSELPELLGREDLSDGVTIAALFLVRDYLENRKAP